MPSNELRRAYLRRSHRLAAAVAILACVVTVASACSSSGGSKSSGTSTRSSSASGSATPKGSGPVNVLYAGSLVDLMEKQLSPGFNSTTGYTFTGFSGGSTALAAQIKGKVRQGDVFISASPKADALLQGADNGNWVSWYGTFATAPIVIGYNANSKFAADLKSKPWYQVITEPGFRLGRTDPKTDPKGVLAAQALTETAQKQNEPALASLATSSDGVFPEETLVGRLQAGQLDAGFFYSAEAVAAHIPTVPLTGVDLAATYTVTVLSGAPHESGAEAFVKYLLGPAGQAVLREDGFVLTTPVTVTGTGVPPALSGVLPGQ